MNILFVITLWLATQQVYNHDYESALHTLSCCPLHNYQYYFFKATAEYSLALKGECSTDISMLLTQPNLPVRYKALALAIQSDMSQWHDNDLGSVVRKMAIAQDRLALSKGGPITQQVQKDIIAGLDKQIKKLEDEEAAARHKQESSNGQEQKTSNSKPMTDSNIANDSGAGKIDTKYIDSLAKDWGKLPDKERTKAMMELTRDMPSKYREVVENYVKYISK